MLFTYRPLLTAYYSKKTLVQLGFHHGPAGELIAAVDPVLGGEGPHCPSRTPSISGLLSWICAAAVYCEKLLKISTELLTVG